MAQCKVTPQEFIQNTFSPTISVICSPLVDVACRKNNLSFVELLQPFCRLNVEAQLRDPSGSAIAIRNLRINLLNVNSRPPHPALARKYLNASVAVTSDIRKTTINVNDFNLEVPTTYPWFDMWRETFLQLQYPSEHEFTKHFLASVVVVSSSEPNPVDSITRMLQSLTQLQSSGQSKFPKWFGTNVLKYFVVLHDTIEGNGENAIKTIEYLKQTYGPSNCFLLQMNSRPPGITDDQFLPDPWSQFLVRKADPIETIESESPQTPADAGDVTSMPSNVTTGSRSTSGTTSPTMSRNVPKLEVGQEINENIHSVPVTFHPLSPDVESQGIISNDEEESLTINTNVWQDVSPSPVVHGACLTTEDIEQLKLLVHEFYLKALLPYVEKQIQRLNDTISNKKGVSRSLFSATKRWFTPHKLGSSGTGTAVNTVIYAEDSPELQLRRLGDLYFMFGHYNMAFQAYHSVKRDFNADQAWLYYAGALEMAALSAFMCGEVTRKTCDYMEESIVTYLFTCRMPQFATRVTLLSTECLKSKGQYGDAAHQLIRMTSEDSDLRSALLLEQAAYCFLNCHKPRMVRKYAFHIILAGHRFSKCLQRKHSLRCYRQAFQVYNNKGWSLAEDHIYFTIGRQATNLKQLEEAKEAFSKLLTPKSKQNAQQQTVFLKEYLNIYVLLKKENNNQSFLPILPMPILSSNETKVLLGPQLPVSIPARIPASGVSFNSDENSDLNEKWTKLEQMMVQEACGSQQMIFKPVVTLFSSNNGCSVKPVAVIGEPIQILVSLHNTLQISLPLKDVFLLWKFTEKNCEITVTNESNVEENKLYDYIKTDQIQICNISPDSTEKLVLILTPLAVGELIITGICYTIMNNNIQDGNVGIIGKQDFDIRGPRLTLKEKDNQPIYGQDKRLNVTITPPAPCLQVGFTETNQELLCNELQHITIELRNCGTTPLHKIMMASSVPHLFSLSTNHGEKETNKKCIIPINALKNNRLEPGQSHIINIWLRAPPTKGPALVNILTLVSFEHSREFEFNNLKILLCDVYVAYSLKHNNDVLKYVSISIKYRLVRHMWHFSVQDSLETEINVRYSSDCNNVQTLTMSLQATNSNEIHHAAVSEITLLKATLMSYDWKFSEDAVIPKDIKLQSLESVYFLLKAYRSPSKNDMVQFSELILSLRKKINSDIKQPCINFAENSVYFNKLKNNSTNNIEAMLILGWQALVTDSAGNKRTVIGQHYIPIENIGKIYKSSENVTNPFVPQVEINEVTPINENILQVVLQNQVSYSIAHSPMLTHNFESNKICIVPVKLILYSSVNFDLTVKINTRGTSSDLVLNKYKNELFNPNSSNYFRWMGHSEFICNIKPYSSYQLQLNIAVVSPGTYDLGERIEVSCKQASNLQETILQTCRVQNALIIKDINKH